VLCVGNSLYFAHQATVLADKTYSNCIIVWGALCLSIGFPHKGEVLLLMHVRSIGCMHAHLPTYLRHYPKLPSSSSKVLVPGRAGSRAAGPLSSQTTEKRRAASPDSVGPAVQVGVARPSLHQEEPRGDERSQEESRGVKRSPEESRGVQRSQEGASARELWSNGHPPTWATEIRHRTARTAGSGPPNPQQGALRFSWRYEST
jgi:hypothetical protein